MYFWVFFTPPPLKNDVAVTKKPLILRTLLTNAPLHVYVLNGWSQIKIELGFYLEIYGIETFTSEEYYSVIFVDKILHTYLDDAG